MILLVTPTALASYTMAEQMGGDAELANEIVTVGTVASMPTIFLWMFIFKQLGAY